MENIEKSNVTESSKSNQNDSKVQNNSKPNTKQETLAKDDSNASINTMTAADVINNNNDNSSSIVKDASTPLRVDTNTITDEGIVSPCVSPPTFPTSLKPTLIEDDDVSQYNHSDEQFLCPSNVSQANVAANGVSVGNNTDIPVDKENPMRCVECGEEFVNHFRYDVA